MNASVLVVRRDWRVRIAGKTCDRAHAVRAVTNPSHNDVARAAEFHKFVGSDRSAQPG
jgi:hypothetical protein